MMKLSDVRTLLEKVKSDAVPLVWVPEFDASVEKGLNNFASLQVNEPKVEAETDSPNITILMLKKEIDALRGQVNVLKGKVNNLEILH